MVVMILRPGAVCLSLPFDVAWCCGLVVDPQSLSLLTLSQDSVLGTYSLPVGYEHTLMFANLGDRRTCHWRPYSVSLPLIGCLDWFGGLGVVADSSTLHNFCPGFRSPNPKTQTSSRIPEALSQPGAPYQLNSQPATPISKAAPMAHFWRLSQKIKKGLKREDAPQDSHKTKGGFAPLFHLPWSSVYPKKTVAQKMRRGGNAPLPIQKKHLSAPFRGSGVGV